MTTVDFITFCHDKHIYRLHEPNTLEGMVASHGYLFDNVLVIHQRCKGIEYQPFSSYFYAPIRIIESESHPHILTEFNIGEDAIADHYTHGPNAPDRDWETR